MDFEGVYEKFRPEINVIALSQRIVGMDYDDVVSEMLACLWRASETWKPDHGIKFGVYWWSLWLNRKSDLIAAESRVKRPRTWVTDDDSDLDASISDRYAVPIPRGLEGLERLAWMLLASGEPPTSTRTTLGMPVRAYYALIRSLRTDEIHALLKKS